MSLMFKKYYDISRLVIWGENEVISDNSKKPKLVLGFRDGNPRLTVYTGVSGREGVISFPCDAVHIVAIMHLLKDVIKSPPGEKFAIESLRTLYENNKPTTEKQNISTLYIGKSKEGIIYFSIISENCPKVIFPIKPSPFHIFRDSNKNIIPDNKISEIMANGIADLVLNIVSNALVNYTNEEYLAGKKQVTINSKNENDIDRQIIENLEDIEI